MASFYPLVLHWQVSAGPGCSHRAGSVLHTLQPQLRHCVLNSVAVAVCPGRIAVVASGSSFWRGRWRRLTSCAESLSAPRSREPPSSSPCRGRSPLPAAWHPRGGWSKAEETAPSSSTCDFQLSQMSAAVQPGEQEGRDMERGCGPDMVHVTPPHSSLPQ